MQVTIKRLCYLYCALSDTVTYVRGGRLAASLFGNKGMPPACDVSVRSDEDGTWYGRVRTRRSRWGYIHMYTSFPNRMRGVSLNLTAGATADERYMGQEVCGSVVRSVVYSKGG